MRSVLRASRRALVLGAASALALGWLGSTPAAFAADAPAVGTLEGTELRAALLRGGYVIYFRHASTDFSTNDDAMTSFEDCSKQRNLTDEGRSRARQIGAGIAALSLPIGDVIASPYCRTRETAQLAFGRAIVSNDVRGGPPADASRYAALARLISTPVSGATNRVIVSHGNPFAAVAGPPYLAEGEAAIIEPRGSEGFRIVGRVPWNGWPALAR